MRIVLRIITIFFFFLSFGTILETYRIFTSDAFDIMESRGQLLPLSIVISIVCFCLMILFWVLSVRARKKYRKSRESLDELKSAIDGDL